MTVFAHRLPDAPLHQLWRVQGRHRARFLHAMTTTEVQKRTPGMCGFACVMTANGKHGGQLRFEVEPESILLSGEAAGLAGALQVLTKHRVADDVRWTLDPLGESTTTVVVAGDEAAQLLGRVIEGVPEAGTWRELTWPAGATTTAVRVSAWSAVESEFARPSYRVRLERAQADAFVAALAAAGATTLDTEGWDALRIRAGWPRDGVDLDAEDATIYSERLKATISETKGCFLGQEVFVMARDLGEAPRKLIVVAVGNAAPDAPEVAGAGPSDPLALTTPEGAPVGRAGSFAAGHALAVVKRKQANPETLLIFGDGRTARVTPLRPA